MILSCPKLVEEVLRKALFMSNNVTALNVNCSSKGCNGGRLGSTSKSRGNNAGCRSTIAEKWSLRSVAEKKFKADGVLVFIVPSERNFPQRCLAEVAVEIFSAMNLLFAESKAFEARDRSCLNLS